jgi:hypothetical protein
MPESRQSEDKVCSEAANRLLAMTRDIEQHFQHINQYKRAREQVLEQIKQNRAGVNYVGQQ